MVTKEEVEQLMLRYFPSCPLCGANTGYKVSGLFKDYVECRSCGAKWQSNDFIGGKELKILQLWEPSHDGKGASLKRKRYFIRFWQDSNAIEYVIEEKRAKEIEEADRKKERRKRAEDNIFEMLNDMMGASEGYGKYKTYKGEIPVSLREMIWGEEHKPDRFLMAMKPFYIKWKEFLHSEDLRKYVEDEKGRKWLARLPFSRDFTEIVATLNAYRILLVTGNVSLAAIYLARSTQSVFGDTDPNYFLQQVLRSIDRALGM